MYAQECPDFLPLSSWTLGWQAAARVGRSGRDGRIDGLASAPAKLVMMMGMMDVEVWGARNDGEGRRHGPVRQILAAQRRIPGHGALLNIFLGVLFILARDVGLQTEWTGSSFKP